MERFLQINVAAMVTLGTLLLGMGERNPSLPLWMALIVVAAFWLTDVAGWFQLNRIVVNLAAVAALAISFWGVRRLDSLVQLFAIANLLVYLQIILVFQKKEIRTYWQLLLVSLLQVVVAAAFNQEFWFGVLLFVYLFVGLSAMVLLFLHQERTQQQRRAEPPASAADPRWALAGKEPEFSKSLPGQTGLVGELFGGLARMIVAIVFLTTLVFFTLPRVGTTGWRQMAGAPLRSVGFSDEVALGELGRVIEDAQEVMRIRFVDHASGRLYPVSDDVYLRGAILTHYDRGKWSYPGRAVYGRYRRVEPERFLPTEKLVRQQIVIEPMDRQELFCVWPFLAVQTDPRIRYDAHYQRLLRPDDSVFERFSFELGTTAMERNQQVPLVPNDSVVLPHRYLQPVPVEGPDGLPGLVELARNWLEQYGVSPEDRYRAARLLERQFQESGRFQYSLEGQPRAPNLDPVEDFVTKHSAGHCEYFASALALMLRSQGIPARMVVGFRTGEWNDLGGFFQVRQLHAHTWVEAFLEPRHVPSQLIHSDRRWDWSAGGWLRLDPTPSGADQMSLANRLLTRFDAYLSWLDYLWSNYITDMDQARQRRAVYEPTVEILKNTGRNLFDPAWWWRFVSSLVEIDINRWFRWQVGLASIVIMLAMVFAYRSLRRAVPWLLGRFVADRAKAAGRRPRVEFYRRLEAILARHGLVRDPWQTQREFAAAARVHLARTSGDGKLAGLPVEIAEAYYRVRFGRQSLDNDQVEAIEQALRQLVGHRSPARRAL